MTGTGFTVGDATTDARVNEAGRVYHWTALKAAGGELEVGTYQGNGTTTSVPVAFQPDWVAVFGDHINPAVHRSSALTGDTSVYFQSTAPTSGLIQALTPTGFQVGANASVNANLAFYHFVAAKNTAGRFASGAYTGDSADDRTFTGIGLTPKWAIVRATTIARSSVFRPDTLVNDASFAFVNSTPAPNQIQVLMANGFQVGSESSVNTGGFPYIWVAFGGPAAQSRVKSGRYTGTGVAAKPITVGFQPDVVFVKRTGADPQQNAVLRTSSMTGDLTKSLDNAGVALAGDLVQSLTATGFTVGADVAVNESGSTYHWVAFKAAPGELVVGSYTGDNAANRTMSVGFQPDFVVVMPPGGGDPAGMPVWTSSTFPADDSFDFDATYRSPGAITALHPAGFQVGRGNGVNPYKAPDLNAGSTEYHYVAWNAVPGRMAVGTYVGNDLDNQAKNAAGFFPEWVLVKKDDIDTIVPGEKAVTHKPASTGTGAEGAGGLRFAELAPAPNTIQKLLPLGFEIGSDGRVNQATLSTTCRNGPNPCAYHWIAFGPHAPPTFHRSVGTSTGNLNASGRTVTISGTTATFSGSMPTNVGVGDVLQYQVPPAGPYYLAFVQARLSDTVYSVKSATGDDPQPAGAGTAVGVYRAYTSLTRWESQDENDTLDDSVENFDTSRDLVASGAVMGVACYNDGPMNDMVAISSSWITGPASYISVYRKFCRI